jgi:chromosome segregation ATPase
VEFEKMANNIFKLLGGEKAQSINTMRVPWSPEARAELVVHEKENVPPLPSEETSGTSRLATVQSEFERFAAVFSREVTKHSNAHAKLEADHALLERRHTDMTKEFRETRETLEIAQSQNASFLTEQAKSRSEYAGALRKLDGFNTELQVARDKLTQQQSRCDILEAGYASAMQECSRREVAMMEARQEINDLSQLYETARVQVEQGRHRESDMDARNMKIEIELNELNPKFEDVSRQAAQQREKLMSLEAELKFIQSESDVKAAQIIDLQEERERLVASSSALSSRLDDVRHSSEMKIEALSRTKNFLWGMSEKQRKQIADQITRISRLESHNSKLTQALMDANRASEAKNTAAPQKASAKVENGRLSEGSLLN